VHVPDDRLRPLDHLAVELDHDPEHAVRRRVLRPDVEDHLLGLELAGGDDVDPAAAHEGGDLVALEGGTRRRIDHRAGILPRAEPRRPCGGPQ
jgi:hypothetical protein